MKPTRVLFLLKKRGEYYTPDPTPPKHVGWPKTNQTGLSNSVAFVVDMLTTLGIEAAYQRVQDDNAIDAAVTAYRPTHAIVEALWVRPEKLAQLAKLHPAIHWNVRLHSELPFIAQEGIAIQWLFAYARVPHISISANSARAVADFTNILQRPIGYTPNYYPLSPLQSRAGLPADHVLDVGCFGAIRPLKNQFTQAVAAIEFARAIKSKLRFHINADRIEMGGAQVLKNIQALFANSGPNYQLVPHQWMDRADFMALVKLMDIGLQVSFSETFNIVSADMTIANVPLVTSPEVAWVAPVFQADPTSAPAIVQRMQVAYYGQRGDLQRLNYAGLEAYDAASEKAWPTALTKMAGM